MRFYVYELSYPDGTVFYVGKGTGRRMFEHDREAKRGHICYKCNVIRKIWREGGEVLRTIVFETNEEQEAHDHEVYLIAFYGRDNLTNLSDGGEGLSNPPPEVREKIAAWHRGRKASEETREKLRNREYGDDWSDRIRAAKQDISEETRAKISVSRKGKPGHAHTAESKAKIGAKSPGFTPEAREKARQAHLGSKHSPETREKIRAGSKANTPEWREKQRAGLLAWARRRLGLQDEQEE